MSSIPSVAPSPPTPTSAVQADVRAAAPDPAIARTVLQHSEAQQAEKTPAARTIALEKLEAVVKEINAFLKSQSSSLEFTHDKASGLDVVKVIDASTSEVIRQYPSEQVVRIAQDLGKISGSLLKEQA